MHDDAGIRPIVSPGRNDRRGRPEPNIVFVVRVHDSQESRSTCIGRFSTRRDAADTIGVTERAGDPHGIARVAISTTSNERGEY